MKQKFLNAKNAVVASVVMAAMAAIPAHAALDAAVATTLDTIEADATALMPLLYGVMAVVTGGLVIFGLVKRGIKRAV